ncbi:GGDEF domain-containing protein [Acerihabitans sp. KWT182]|uniref:GGDEF domain-containing protein n=1 Tax=Acerihabitans sp. KWT182 TaxID=3157919 RepID=A0AAU7Q5Z7_9GAMM
MAIRMAFSVPEFMMKYFLPKCTVSSSPAKCGEMKFAINRNPARFFWEDVTIIPEVDDRGNIIRYFTIRFDVTKQVRNRMKFYHKSQRDNLTRVFNRHGFYNQAGVVIKNMSAVVAQSFYVAIFDADKFKSINDTLGHNQGDKLLRLLAVRTKNVLGEDTLLGRLGGR